jgi:hypothetical protein
MKLLLKSYRNVSIWFSLAILMLFFVAVSDAGWRSICVLTAFLLGAILFTLGSIRGWKLNYRLVWLGDGALAAVMWLASVWMAFELGGIL